MKRAASFGRPPFFRKTSFKTPVPFLKGQNQKFRPPLKRRSLLPRPAGGGIFDPTKRQEGASRLLSPPGQVPRTLGKTHGLPGVEDTGKQNR